MTHPRSRPFDAAFRTSSALVALAVAALALAACGPVQAVTEDVATTLISVEEERRMGARIAAQLEEQVELVDDPAVQRYVQRIGEELVATDPDAPEGMAYEFKVIDAPDQVNAVALPGGYIYVFSGMLRAAEDEAELAGVLSHEIAHVTQRHVAERLVAQLGVETLAQIALGGDPGIVRQLAAGVAARGVITQFSRDAEREADHYGVIYMSRAGWSPYSYAQFFDKLARARDAPGVLAWLQTHPAPSERAENARQLIARMGDVPRFTGEARFQRVQSRLEPRVSAAGP